MARLTTVRYGRMRLRALFAVETRDDLSPGDVCVVRSSRGEELGTVLARPIGGAEDEGNRVGCADGACGSCASPKGRVLRIAQEEERAAYEEQVKVGTREEVRYTMMRAKEIGVPLQVVGAEYLLAREKLILHFTSNGRVEFKELSVDVGRKFSTRTEFVQIGARDEARLVGDHASCGRELCCRSFLHDLKPVSMRMAKQQKKTLDPTKIAGQCGKLKCCLRYEDDVYVELQKTMPRRGSWVEIEGGKAKVLSIDLLLQKLVVELAGDREVVHVSELLARGLDPPKPGEAVRRERPVRRKKVTPLQVPPRPEASSDATEEDPAEATEPVGEETPTRSLRRSRSKIAGGEAADERGKDSAERQWERSSRSRQSAPSGEGPDSSDTPGDGSKSEDSPARRSRRNRRSGRSPRRRRPDSRSGPKDD